MINDKLLVAMAQLQPSSDVNDNLARIEDLARRAAAAGATVAVFPELAITGWGADAEANRLLAEKVDGPSVGRLGELADDAGVTVVAGLYESNGDQQPYNTLVAVAPTAGVVAAHRKAHLYDAWGYRESDEVTAGDGELATFTVEGTRFGLVNCYEIRFPERARALVDAGCEVLSVSAAWARGPLKEEHWLLNLRARAVENTAWVIGASSTGPEVVGRSAIVDPFGVVRAELDERSDDWTMVHVSSERTKQAKQVLPIRKQREAAYYR